MIFMSYPDQCSKMDTHNHLNMTYIKGELCSYIGGKWLSMEKIEQPEIIDKQEIKCLLDDMEMDVDKICVLIMDIKYKINHMDMVSGSND